MNKAQKKALASARLTLRSYGRAPGEPRYNNPLVELSRNPATMADVDAGIAHLVDYGNRTGNAVAVWENGIAADARYIENRRFCGWRPMNKNSPAEGLAREVWAAKLQDFSLVRLA